MHYMKQDREPRQHRLVIQLSETEHQQIREHGQASTCRHLSAYCRQVLLGKPVFVRYRNTSADQALLELLALKKELMLLCGQFERVISQLEPLRDMASIRSWVIREESLQAELLEKTGEIYEMMIQISRKW
jgi:hypothetical protein